MTIPDPAELGEYGHVQDHNDIADILTAQVAINADHEARLDNLGVVNIQDYGAVGDDSTDNITSIQAALDVAEAGGGVVFIPEGVFLSSGTLEVGTGVTLRGSRGSVLKRSGAAGGFIRLVGDSDCRLENVYIDGNGIASIGIISVGSGAIARHAIVDCVITGTTNNGYRVSSAVDNCLVSNNSFISCASGVSFQHTSGVSTGIRIVNNSFSDVGVNNLQVYGASGLLYKSVLIQGNILRDFDTPSTAIPIEIGCSEGVVISDNLIATAATRGIGCGQCTDVTISGNSVRDQTLYAFEIANNQRVVMDGNTAYSCASFIQDTATGTTDLVISNNVYRGTGLSSLTAGSAAIKLNNTDSSRIKIFGNSFSELVYIETAIRVLGTGYTITDNIFDSASANTASRFVLARGSFGEVSRNTIILSRDLVAGDADLRAISLTMGTSATIDIADNIIRVTGDTSATAVYHGIGSDNAAAGTLSNCRVRRNTVAGAPVGIVFNTTSTTATIERNDTAACATPYGTINAAVLVRSTSTVTEATAAPSSGAWRRGDICWNTTPSAAGVPGWVCTTAGSPGTWKAMAAVAA